MSIAATITRTPLARADSIKAITIETYGQDDLVGQTLSSSQVGLFLSPYDLDLSFDFIGDTVTSTCEPESCIPYIVLQDWIDRILDSDVDYVNQNRDDNVAPPLNREQIGEGFSARFEYFPDAEPNYRWNLVVSFLGNEQVIPGYIIGFNGSTGAFLPPGEEMGTQVILFSVDNSLSTNATIGQFTPYGDQPTRNIPIRDFLEIWNYSEVRYMQGQG